MTYKMTVDSPHGFCSALSLNGHKYEFIAAGGICQYLQAMLCDLQTIGTCRILISCGGYGLPEVAICANENGVTLNGDTYNISFPQFLSSFADAIDENIQEWAMDVATHTFDFQDDDLPTDANTTLSPFQAKTLKEESEKLSQILDDIKKNCA